jgi:hypothetical protein
MRLPFDAFKRHVLHHRSKRKKVGRSVNGLPEVRSKQRHSKVRSTRGLLSGSSQTALLPAKLIVKTVQFRPSKHSSQAYCWNMSHNNRPIPRLRKAPQPPLAYPGAIPDSDRAKKPPLGGSQDAHQELNPGDRVEGLGNFGKPNGELGTVERTNEEDAVVKWDDDGRTRLH